MHHVDDPRKMAHEIVRVTKKHFFLIESNGTSVLRRLFEKSKRNRMFGEKSYTAGTYKRFFTSTGMIKKIDIKPFLYIVSFTPSSLITTAAKFSEFMEKVPLLRWQGSGVIITGEKK